MSKAEELRKQAQSVIDQQTREEKEQSKRTQEHEKRAAREQLIPMVTRCMKAAEEAAAKGEMKARVYWIDRVAFLAAPKVAQVLIEEYGLWAKAEIYSHLVGMDVEGYGGHTQYSAAIEMKWDEAE